jgi:hypothetical protein
MKKVCLWLGLMLAMLSMACYWLPTQTPPDKKGENTPTIVPTLQIITMTPQGEELMRIPHNIDHVASIILESSPPQVQLDVHGWHDGCDYPTQVTQEQSGNTITVNIFRDVPLAVACPMNLVEYQATIALEGTFEAGQTYTVIVNGFEVEVKL